MVECRQAWCWKILYLALKASRINSDTRCGLIIYETSNSTSTKMLFHQQSQPYSKNPCILTVPISLEATLFQNTIHSYSNIWQNRLQILDSQNKLESQFILIEGLKSSKRILEFLTFVYQPEGYPIS